jgi:hypothetical protein
LYNLHQGGQSLEGCVSLNLQFSINLATGALIFAAPVVFVPKLLFGNQCYYLNLNPGIPWQTGDGNRSPRWRRFGKEPRVDLVHPGKLFHIRKKDGGFYDLIETAASRLEHCPQILQNLLGLFRNSSGNELTSLRIGRDLTRSEHESTSLNRLRVRADGSRCILCLDSFPQNKTGILTNRCNTCHPWRSVFSHNQGLINDLGGALEAFDVKDTRDALD